MRRHRFVVLSLAIAASVSSAFSLRSHARAADVPTQPMDAHMEMTLHASPEAGDRARADAIVAAARRVMAAYPNVAAAEAAGFSKFLPSVPLPVEHYTNDAYAMEALTGPLDPMHPTSLIFKRDGRQLTLVGVMYTAARDATTADLNRRVPLSIGTWHRHVAFCAGPPGTPSSQYFGSGAKYGLLGSISTKAACDAAGGSFEPVVFGWMIHVWPNEKDQAKIWAVDPDGSMSRESGTMSGAGMQ
jgi:hypothetical protein